MDPELLLSLSGSLQPASRNPLPVLRQDLARMEAEISTWVRRLRYLAEALAETPVRQPAGSPKGHDDKDLHRVLAGGIDDLNLALATAVAKARQTASWAALAPCHTEPDAFAVWQEIDPGAPRPSPADDSGPGEEPAAPAGDR